MIDIDTEYIQEQLKYMIENAESEGATVDKFDTFEVYANDNDDELITVMAIDFEESK